MSLLTRADARNNAARIAMEREMEKQRHSQMLFEEEEEQRRMRGEQDKWSFRVSHFWGR